MFGIEIKKKDGSIIYVGRGLATIVRSNNTEKIKEIDGEKFLYENLTQDAINKRGYRTYGGCKKAISSTVNRYGSIRLLYGPDIVSMQVVELSTEQVAMFNMSEFLRSLDSATLINKGNA